ncbi:MAG: RHS repeat-associated core domain-containing protein [Chloroflexi bacterium]|nr:RHS repeat-associated core domain-containing protein [Chloroflexota bacterium]
MGYNNSAHPNAVTHLNGVQKFWYSDANGNMTQRIDDTGDWNLGWTTENQLQSAAIMGGTTISFVYDADGMLVKRVENSNETIYLGKLYQHELFGSFNQIKHFVFNGRIVARRVGLSVVRFFLTDHLGSTTTTVSGSGTKVADLRYDPWGEERWSYQTTPTGYRYTGQRWDGTMGLHDYNARYYDPSTGRFISADTVVPGMSGAAVGPNSEERLTPLTVAFHETMFLGQANEENRHFLTFGPSILWNSEQKRELHVPMGPLNPQALGRYAYVLNNPLRYSDPTGHWIARVTFSIIVSSVQATAIAAWLNYILSRSKSSLQRDVNNQRKAQTLSDDLPKPQTPPGQGE